LNKHRPYSSLLLLSINGQKVKELAKLNFKEIELSERGKSFSREDVLDFNYSFFRKKIFIRTESSHLLFKMNPVFAMWLDPFMKLKLFFSTVFALICLSPVLYSSLISFNPILTFFSLLTWILFVMLIRATTLKSLARRIFWLFFILLIPALPFFSPFLLLFLILVFIFFAYLSEITANPASRYLLLAFSWLQVCFVFFGAFPLYYEVLYSMLYSNDANISCLDHNRKLGKVLSTDNNIARIKFRSARLHYGAVLYQIKRESGEPIFLSCGPSSKEWMSAVLHWQPYRFESQGNLIQLNLYSAFEMRPKSFLTGVISLPERNIFFSFELSEQDSIGFLLELVNQGVRMTEIDYE
jgi:hypothetical protein